MKYLKKPRKNTDMCHICESGKRILKKIDILEKKTDLNENEKELLKDLLENKSLYDKHKEIYEKQKTAFKNQVSNISNPKEAVIVMDFKQNLVINEIHNTQLGRDWYKSPQRTVFGMVIYYFEDGNIKKFLYDIFSEYMSHDSYFVVKAIQKFFKSNFFKTFKFSDLTFWMDNGPHFKTKELFCTFSKLADGDKTQAEWNFFGEYHGKNPCDPRFSQISSMYKTHVNNQNNFRIQSTAQLVEAIKFQQQQLDQRRLNLINDKIKKKKLILPKPPIPSDQVELIIPTSPVTKPILVISQLKGIFYSFKITKDNKISSSIFTGEDTCRIWEKKYKTVIVKKKKKNIQSPIINEDLDELKIWEGQRAKFLKIDNFLKNPSPNKREGNFNIEMPRKRSFYLRNKKKGSNFLREYLHSIRKLTKIPPSPLNVVGVMKYFQALNIIKKVSINLKVENFLNVFYFFSP